MKSNDSRFTVRYATVPRLVLLGALVMLQACSAIDVLNASVPDSGYRLVEDIKYGSHSRQMMDLYIPSKPVANTQVIVFVYGGAWRSGDRSDYEFVGQALSSAGHTVVIPDYRLYPEVVFPAFVTDVVLAIRSLEDTRMLGSDVPSVDVSSIVLMGHSSGAHTVALIGSDSRYLADTSVSIRAMIVMSGPYDLPLENKEVAPVFGSSSDPKLVNPLTLATAAHPETFLIHGTDDERVEPDHTQRYFSVLQSLGVESRLLMSEGAGHAKVVAVIAAPLQSTSNVTPEIVGFLEQL